MRVRIFDTAKEACIYAAATVEQVVTSRDHPVLGLATGSTVIPLYESLTKLAYYGLDFSHVTTINLDEYIGLNCDHEQSYNFFMQKHLFSRVSIPPRQIHIPNGGATDFREECIRYDRIIEQNPIDLQILGIGVNGHIGFNEPSHLLTTRTHVVDLSEDTIRSNARFFADASEVPHQAITMGMQSILQAKKIILLAFGLQKAQIVQKAFQGGISTNIPASTLQLHPDLTVVLDCESASELSLIHEDPV